MTVAAPDRGKDDDVGAGRRSDQAAREDFVSAGFNSNTSDDIVAQPLILKSKVEK